MVSDKQSDEDRPEIARRVLILVLMEYGLWHDVAEGIVKSFKVLILVLMEYGLWPKLRNHRKAVR